MVVTGDRYATRVGRDTLQAGGNAVDAAVATSFALAVTYPVAGNIGGGGFMVVRMADGTRAALDYREKAPLGASRDMYLGPDSELTDRSLYGASAAGVPGAVMGLWQAHRRFGTLPWAALIEPAVRLAEGFEVHESLHRGVTRAIERIAGLGIERRKMFEGTLETFCPGGEPPAVGSLFRQPALADTLRRIADDGPDGFYGGLTAERIVAEMERNGGWKDAVQLQFPFFAINRL